MHNWSKIWYYSQNRFLIRHMHLLSAFCMTVSIHREANICCIFVLPIAIVIALLSIFSVTVGFFCFELSKIPLSQSAQFYSFTLSGESFYNNSTWKMVMIMNEGWTKLLLDSYQQQLQSMSLQKLWPIHLPVSAAERDPATHIDFPNEVLSAPIAKHRVRRDELIGSSTSIPNWKRQHLKPVDKHDLYLIIYVYPLL